MGLSMLPGRDAHKGRDTADARQFGGEFLGGGREQAQAIAKAQGDQHGHGLVRGRPELGQQKFPESIF